MKRFDALGPECTLDSLKCKFIYFELQRQRRRGVRFQGRKNNRDWYVLQIIKYASININ